MNQRESFFKIHSINQKYDYSSKKSNNVLRSNFFKSHFVGNLLTPFRLIIEENPMRAIVNPFVSTAMFISLVIWLTPVTANGEQISVAGATTTKPIVEEAAKEFAKDHANVTFAVGVGGSARGVELAGKGEVQIGMSCRLPNDKEKAAYPDLIVHPIGTDANGVMLHATNPVQKITAQQVRDIYTGKITNWKELGGNDAPIVLLMLGSKHSSYEVFLDYLKLDGKWENNTAKFKAKDAADYSAVTVPTVDATNDLTASLITKPNGIGFGSVGAVLALAAKGAPLKMCDLEGVPATEENILKGSYPLPRPMLLLTKGEPVGAVKEFIDYMKNEPGRKLLKNKGFFSPK
jgi:phosphate transport system substrate-binding protein